MIRLLLAATLIAPATAGIGVQTIASGFERPVWVGAPAKSNDKLWVIEQAGRIWMINANTGERHNEPFLDIREDVSRVGNEEGLLGLAFAPDYETSGRFYVNYTDKKQMTRIVRFTAKPGTSTIDPASAEEILSFKQPFRNHNGGWIDFGPDGMLYIGNGDGGAGNDPHKAGQDLNTLLGKILRIDVSGKTGYTIPKDNPFVSKDKAKPEIWAYGVRNPWRCSFDRKTGDFWMGDVGQNKIEEINFTPKGKASGANFGWRVREGDIATPDVGGDKPSGVIEPVYVYPHGMGPKEGLSVTGGYVYRGPIKELYGQYIFADYQNPRTWAFTLKGNKADNFKDLTNELKPEGKPIIRISSFGEDPKGNLYIVEHDETNGRILRIVEK